MQEMAIRDRLAIILWARKLINKHNLVKVVQEKENQMLLEVKDFKKCFNNTSMKYFLHSRIIMAIYFLKNNIIDF